MRRLLVLLGLGIACSRSDSGSSIGVDGSLAEGAGGTSRPATPVKLGAVTRTTLSVIVSAPGRTDAFEQQRVRAPFKGTLTSLRVADGDSVRDGELIGTLVAQDSEAALAGARAMLREARTTRERSDAQRALALAKRGLVKAPLRAPEAGVIVAHKANEGDRVQEGDDIVGIAASDSIVFIADVVQSSLADIHPGQRATVRIAARPAPLTGSVHGVLPSASSKNLTAPVRIDLSGSPSPVELGLFGTAEIVVGEHANALTIPKSAVLRDDIAGTSRIAAVSGEKVHWLPAVTGIEQGDLVELTSPALPVGQQIVLSGQVGLLEGASVKASP